MLIVTYLFCSCQLRVNLSPCTHAGVAPPPTSQRHIPSCSSSRVAHHVDCHLSFLFLPTAGESSALPPCWCHPTANVSTTLPISFIIEGENYRQNPHRRRQRGFRGPTLPLPLHMRLDGRFRRFSPFTSCGIVLILLLVVDAGVVSSLPRLAPFDALIIDEGGGEDRAGGRRTTMPAPVAPSPLPFEARRSLLPEAHFDGNLVDARRQRSPRTTTTTTTTTTTITPSVAVFLLLHRVYARRLLLRLLVVRARRRPGLNPYFALPVPTAERRRAASSRHRATIADATMIPAVTILGRRGGKLFRN